MLNYLSVFSYHAFKNPKSENEPTKAFSCGDKIGFIHFFWRQCCRLSRDLAHDWHIFYNCATLPAQQGFHVLNT